MRRVLGLWGLVIGCTSSGVPTEVPSPLPVAVAPPPAPLATDPLRSAADAEHPRRYVGKLLQGTACPTAVNGWVGGPLFGATPGGPSVPPGLAPFCLYTLPNTAPLGGGPVTATSRGLFSDLSPDVMALATQSTLEDALGAGLAAATDAEAGRLAWLGNASGFAPVRVAVLDSSPTAPPGAPSLAAIGVNAHGHGVANLIARLTCDDAGTCAAEVATRLVMTLRTVAGQIVEDPVNGGDFGSVGVLAEGLWAETAAWEADATDAPLVVNLSLGWDRLYGGSPALGPSGWPAAVQAAHAAIVDARCRGAMVLAATGNRQGGTRDVGPLVPALWESMTIDPAVCASMLGGPGAIAGVEPTVLAVGGATRTDVDIALQRNGARPRRLAYADHAVVPDASGLLTEPLTGTSVGTAIASATAAVLWANRPYADDVQISGWLTTSGWATAMPVDGAYCPTGCGNATVVDVCRAVRAVCDPGQPAYTGPCAMIPAGPVGCSLGIQPPAVVDAAALASFEAAAAAETLAPQAAVRTDRACDRNAIALLSTEARRGPSPCPMEQFYTAAAEPWLYPQPIVQECPTCYLSLPDGKVRVDWASGFASLTSLTLYTRTLSGTTTAYTTRQFPATGTTLTYTFANPSVLTGTETAWLAAVTSRATYEVPLYVIP